MSAQFKTIVTAYQDRIYNTCLGFVKQAADAEDLAQEVFIEVYKNLSKFRGEADTFTWVYRIAVNKCLAHVRSAKATKRTGTTYALNEDFDQPASTYYHPGVKLENKEQAAILMRAIDALPEQQRIAFTLNKIDGLSYEKIDKIMEKTQDSIASILHRAKMNLRKQLHTYYENA